MKLPFLFENLKSNYCKIVFGLSLFLAYALTPKSALEGWYLIISIPFIFLFALTTACSTRSIKEKIKVTHYQKKSILAIVANVLGISALQMCGIGAPLCGASVGIGLLSTILPGALFNVLKEYNIAILIVSIVVQITTLQTMNCFSKNIHGIQKGAT